MFFCTQYFSQNQLRNKKKTRGKERTGNDDASRGRGRHLWQDAILFCLPIYAPKLARSCCAGALTCHSGYNLLCDPMRLCNFIYYIWCLEIFAYSTYTGRLILIGRAKVEAKSESLRMTYGWSIFQEDILLDQIPCHYDWSRIMSWIDRLWQQNNCELRRDARNYTLNDVCSFAFQQLGPILSFSGPCGKDHIRVHPLLVLASWLAVSNNIWTVIASQLVAYSQTKLKLYRMWDNSVNEFLR